MKNGSLYAVGAYAMWGLLPLYWKALSAVPAIEILAHRIVWALIFVALVLALRGRWRPTFEAMRQRGVLLTYLASALLLGFNWYMYIWAVNAGQVVEASLGYFITPLVSVLLGVICLKERLRLGQGLAVALALGGVLVLGAGYGAVPWIALSLAITFGLYGLLRKIAPLGSLEGLTLETMLLFVPALGLLLVREAAGGAAFWHAGAQVSLLLAISGAVTAVPLLLFAAGARRIPLFQLGLFQYISPTLQLLLGVALYGEPFGGARLVGFGLIWAALAVYTAEGMLTGARSGQAA